MSNELLVNRHEDKYSLSIAEATRLKDRISRVLKSDEHNRGGGYRIRSLYFDTIENTDFYEKFAGLEERKKIRLRSYDVNSDLCKLEYKEKKGSNQRKRSLIIDRGRACEIISGNYSVLLNGVQDNDTALFFYKEMTLGGYRPVTIIDYKREAYIYDLYKVRITFDYDIMAAENCRDFFEENNDEFMPVLDGSVILEVKYDGCLPEYISKVLEPFDLCQQSYSKYCIGRTVWNYL